MSILLISSDLAIIISKRSLVESERR